MLFPQGFTVPRKVKIITGGFFISILIILRIGFLLFPVNININYSPAIFDVDSNLIHAYLSTDDKWRLYSNINEISPDLKKAILFKEDKFFYGHPGINPISMVRAAINNFMNQKRTSGASTITMQVARLLNPAERTYKNKLKEIFRALQIEKKMSKDEILQMYLNLTPYGGNLEGIKSASVIYFEKLPEHMSLSELTLLSIIPNRPNTLKPGVSDVELLKVRDQWLNRFKKAHIFPNSNIDIALNEPLTFERKPVPSYIPHLARRLKNENRNSPLIYSTINMKYQTVAESITRNYISRLYDQHIKNATLLVVENESRNIIAYVGSADFFNPEDGGQVDGIKAKRSPGSTLKPFLYGYAFEKGIITPKYKLSDVPVSFNGYEPENYDGQFRGLITAEDALANSLNVPAASLLQKMGVNTFMNLLASAGIKSFNNKETQLGLSLILGGCEVTSLEMATLYCGLANNGKVYPINYLKSDIKEDPFEFFSASSSFMVHEILMQLVRPDFPETWQNSTDIPKIAWKTGTSYGRKDAWSIGYNKKYTVCVWVGNFSGEGVPEISGARSAAPLLFSIFKAIDPIQTPDWYSMPDQLDFRYVCDQTGLLPSESCQNSVMDYYIPGVSEMKICDHLKNVLISADSSVSYCMSCLPESGYKKALYTNYSPEILQWRKTNHVYTIEIPKHNPKCDKIFQNNHPVITSPINSNSYYISKDDSLSLLLSCNSASDAEKIFWYVNDFYVGWVYPGDPFFITPEAGKLKISCTDDKGRNDEISCMIEFIRF